MPLAVPPIFKHELVDEAKARVGTTEISLVKAPCPNCRLKHAFYRAAECDYFRERRRDPGSNEKRDLHESILKTAKIVTLDSLQDASSVVIISEVFCLARTYLNFNNN